MNTIYKPWLAGFLFGSATYAFIHALLLEQYFFEIKEFDIGNITTGKNKIKLLHLSDLHLRHITHRHYKLADAINSLNPDLICITGDALDKYGHKNNLEDFLALVNDSIPKLAILGNHDYKAEPSIKTIKQIYTRHNCHLLMNETKIYTINNIRLAITGVDDFIKGKANFTKAVEEIKQEDNHIVLIHSPLQQEGIKKEIKNINANRSDNEKLNISYFLAGHCHGGQVNFFGYAPIMPKKSGKYKNGWYNGHKPYLYVSKGYGTSTLPFRFGAQAEITLFNYYG